MNDEWISKQWRLNCERSTRDCWPDYSYMFFISYYRSAAARHRALTRSPSRLPPTVLDWDTYRGPALANWVQYAATFAFTRTAYATAAASIPPTTTKHATLLTFSVLHSLRDLALKSIVVLYFVPTKATVQNDRCHSERRCSPLA